MRALNAWPRCVHGKAAERRQAGVFRATPTPPGACLGRGVSVRISLTGHYEGDGVPGAVGAPDVEGPEGALSEGEGSRAVATASSRAAIVAASTFPVCLTPRSRWSFFNASVSAGVHCPS